MPSLRDIAAELKLSLQEALGARTKLPAPVGALVCGVNLAGPPVVVQGQRWWGSDEAQTRGLRVPGARQAHTRVVPLPFAERGVRTMLNTVVFRAETLDLSLPLPAGRYEIYLWILENHESHWHKLSLRIGGQPVDHGLGDLARGSWRRHGPYAVTLGGEALSLTLDSGRPEIDAHLMGLSVHRAAG
ncbi:MAG: hypothetical protein JNJ71_08000 [Rubrivivax sp.]|nr:hypothetical protein [Rubrivivax sp.]